MSDSTVQAAQDPVILRVNGIDWAFWKSAEITRQMDAIAGAFSITLSDKWSPQAAALPLAAGMKCEVLIGNDPVINGFIDKVSTSLSAQDHAISITGRDASADMVDCAAVHKPGQWMDQSALQLASVLAQPFGVAVTAPGDVGAPIKSFKLEQGESAFEALDKILKQRELLATPDGRGGLVLLKVGARQSVMPLRQGLNILSASADFDMTDRFSDYLVQSQQPGTDAVYGEEAAAVHAETKDPAVRRYRPMLLRAESSLDSAGARQRAAWECTVRAARAVTVNVTVQGFRQGLPGQNSAPLWQVNALTMVDIPYLWLNQQLLISKTIFKRDAQAGSTTTLELKDPKAFAPEPKREAASGGIKAGAKDAPIEAAKDLQTRMAEEASAQQWVLKEGR